MNSLFRWVHIDPDPGIISHFTNTLDLPVPLARALANRGIKTVEEAERFMNPGRNDLHDPGLMQDMAPAVERIERALANHERILVLGDYDVDGITGAALLVSFLESRGGHVRYYIPERETEGYGLSEEVVRKSKEAGYALILTVDSGISCNSEARVVKELGMDLIVTDHHEPHSELPEAVAVLDPKRSGSTYPFRDLAGVGVAFKLVSALGERCGVGTDELLERYGEFVALGTVGDMAPLLNENRFLAHYGLEKMPRSRNLGIYSLLEVANIRESERMDAHHISFGLAPRLNAAGRVWRPRAGVELLLATSPERARTIARKLDEQNRRRMTEEAQIVKSAVRIIESRRMLPDTHALVLFGEDWQVGIVGIVASKLMETHHKPIVLTTASKKPADIRNPHPEKGRVCQGSARSIPGFDLYEALTGCSDILISYGGHELAAGLKIYEKDIPILRERLNELVRYRFGDEISRPTLNIDADIPLAAAGLDLLRHSAKMKPFGVGNPQPVFSTKDVTVLQCRGVGAENRHLQLRVGQASCVADAIGFGFCEHWPPDQLAGEMIDLAYVIKEDNFSGRARVKLHLKDMRVSRPS